MSKMHMNKITAKVDYSQESLSRIENQEHMGRMVMSNLAKELGNFVIKSLKEFPHKMRTWIDECQDRKHVAIELIVISEELARAINKLDPEEIILMAKSETVKDDLKRKELESRRVVNDFHNDPPEGSHEYFVKHRGFGR